MTREGFLTLRLNFQSLDVVSRCRDPQHQVTENSLMLTTYGSVSVTSHTNCVRTFVRTEQNHNVFETDFCHPTNSQAPEVVDGGSKTQLKVTKTVNGITSHTCTRSSMG